MGGKRLQNVEDAEVVEVGKFYLVPTVVVPSLPKRLQVVPVMGPLHEDAEFINFPHRHYHPDRRFVSDAWMSFHGRGFGGTKGHWGAVYCFKIKRPLDKVERDTGMLEGPRLRMKCQETLRDGHICPHRGISCRGVLIFRQDGL